MALHKLMQSMLASTGGGVLDNLMLALMESFRAAAVGPRNIVGGHLDVFSDATGIGTLGSATHDSTNKLWTNAGAYSSNLVPAMTGYSNPTGIVTTSSDSIEAAWKAFNGTTGGGSTWQTAGSGGGWAAYEFTTAKTLSRYTVTGGYSPYTDRSPNAWTFDGWDGSAWVVLDTRTAQTGWGSTETRTFDITSPASYIKYRLNITANNGGPYCMVDTIEMMDRAISSTATVSTSKTLTGVPTIIRPYLLHKPVVAVTLNTDLIAKVSRDAGTTLTTGVLTKLLDLDNGWQLLACDIDVSGQPSGSSAVWKLETANAKEQQFKAVGLLAA